MRTSTWPATRMLRALLALLLVAPMVVLAAPAYADDEDWAIERFHVEAVVDPDGTVHVTYDFDFDFGTPGHGPVIGLPERQEMADDPEHWRNYKIENVSASSSTGAPADVQEETEKGIRYLRIGDEDVEVTGLQSYQVKATIRGLVNPADRTGSGMDELSWSILSAAEIPTVRLTARVTMPGEIQQSACFSGDGYTYPCGAKHSGEVAEFEEDILIPNSNDGWQIVAGVGAGTFQDPEFFTSRRASLETMFEPSPVSIGLGGLFAVGGAALMGVQVRRKGRDQQYAGVTPGLSGDAASTTARSTGPVAVEFAPPEGIQPGLIGTVVDESADSEDVTATILDLAVRGFLSIREDDPKDFTVVQGDRNPGELAGWERRLYDAFFADGAEARLKDLNEGTFPETVTAVKSELDLQTVKRGWFAESPAKVRARWIGIGMAAVLVGGAAAFGLGFLFGLGWLGVGVALAGVVVMALSGKMPSRTPDGTALQARIEGFRLYLSTAEAEQIKFEEGVDIFSKYLPYAVVFGVAERWVKVFDELRERGVYTADTSWYAGSMATSSLLSSGSLTSALDSFSSATTEAMTAPSDSSSGGSGFSGGGGAGGGSVGGW
ncbi:DUF2207 domain-containing protein [Parenemella sanctibonifatiensis]|uniref:DUF2207 domain-containing protein n=1 Tax=Parenemella sanctibonifatiensis TaxID=2016505 RepID=A0A255EN19_9ACTN|nr:DUF2207 domain-containing protein [Parenemella sanctibonifatiensis]OYN92610.1 hypothetical protein CGZ91_03810 [Parenemella sanctibonifatiensis]